MRSGLFLLAALFLIQFPLFAEQPPEEMAQVQVQVAKAIDRMITEREIKMTLGLHTPWHVVHGLLAYGDQLKVLDPTGKEEVVALDWARNGGFWRNKPSFLTSPGGFVGNHFDPQNAAAFEGHMAQFGGYLSELKLDLATPFQAWNQEKQVWETRPLSALYEDIKQNITISEPQSQDLNNESSWALWALARSGYAKVDETWKNSQGEEINFEKLVGVETRRDFDADPSCGGLHGLFAMSLALRLYKATGKELTGSWAIADFLEQKYIHQAKKHQNEDGSFSANYFSGPGDGETWKDQLPGSGHIFEWLMLVLPQEELSQEWVLKGARSVAGNILEAELRDSDVENYLLMATRDTPDEVNELLLSDYTILGAYFHAVHGLRMFQERIAHPEKQP